MEDQHADTTTCSFSFPNFNPNHSSLLLHDLPLLHMPPPITPPIYPASDYNIEHPSIIPASDLAGDLYYHTSASEIHDFYGYRFGPFSLEDRSIGFLHPPSTRHDQYHYHTSNTTHRHDVDQHDPGHDGYGDDRCNYGGGGGGDIDEDDHMGLDEDKYKKDADNLGLLLAPIHSSSSSTLHIAGNNLCTNCCSSRNYYLRLITIRPYN
jgi:hypothetical protein